jgi:hypothetical protein
MSLIGLVLISAGIVIVVLGIVQVISLAAPSSFLTTVILGEDGRTSTSKTFILLWTLLVAWALISLLTGGELVPTHLCITSGPVASASKRCHHDDVALLQLGWMHFLHGGLTGGYLVLLGVPAAAGVAAKGITQSQAQSSTAVKTTKHATNSSLASRLAEIFSSDDGSTDIADFQYVIFNLITAAYFVARFLRPDANGLPTIPDTLLGLTSVSAGLYVGKKAVTRSQPSVSGVFPSVLQDGLLFTVVGTGLTVDPDAPANGVAKITIDGMPASSVREVNGNLVANAPHNLAVGGGVVTRQLQVLSPYGGITANFPVQCL